MGQRDREATGSRHLRHALAAVEAMGATEAIVVPATPSPRMLVAGARAGRVATATAGRVYRAMVLAGRR